MLRYFKPISPTSEENVGDKRKRNENSLDENNVQVEVGIDESVKVDTTEKIDKLVVEGVIDITKLPSDPGLRTPIINYDFNIRDEIRRVYLQRGPCQPRNHEFPFKEISGKDRRFLPSWFDEYPDWLEYSIAKDAIFCFYCYLFRRNKGEDSFVEKGFSNWKLKDRLQTHVGKPGSVHNQAQIMCQSFRNQKQNIEACFFKQSEQTRSDYRTRLVASIDCIRHLLRQGQAFRGHDESEDSQNQGNFLELLKFLCDHNEEVKAVSLKNAPENLKLTSSDVQKDIVNAIAFETTKLIVKDIGDDSLFSILVDESRDISIKEQMSVVLRYVKNGRVMERLIGIEHVSSTTAISLKDAIDRLFSKYNFSISRLRGQGYDGANNMQGEYNGLKALILKENPSAFYIHCFAHQLQLALVAVANKHPEIETFFYLVSSVLNVVGGSAKRSDCLQEKQRLEIFEALNVGELISGRGLNQETRLKRPGDTRWGSHYNALVNLILMFSSTVEVVEMVANDASSSTSLKRGEARALLQLMVKFEFAFSLLLMKKILGITNELSKALQKKDQDIVNAMRMVKLCKQRLQILRDEEWNSFFATVYSFCGKYNIDIPNMDDMFSPLGRSRRNTVTNLHHFRVDFFYAVIDMQLQELNDRFSETSSDLLLCVACLCPDNLFSAFDKNKLVQMCKYYPKDFSMADIMKIEDQLDMYILDMRSDDDFEGLVGLSELAEKLFLTKKHEMYSLVYKLVTLALILPVATASVERVFSAMKYVKNRLRNRMGDQWLNDSLIVYVEKDVFDTVDNDVIVKRYQSMKPRRVQL